MRQGGRTGLCPGGHGGGAPRVRCERAPRATGGAGLTAWTTDLTDLDGKRFVRYRITTEMSESGTAYALGDPRPILRYFRLPFAW